MMDEFIEFLAGEPYKMDEGWQQTWAYFVGCKMPYILRDWHDPAFREGDVWKKDGAYYESLRLKLAAMQAFKKKCNDADETLRALKLLVDFFAHKKHKEELVKPGKCDKKRDKKKNENLVSGKKEHEGTPEEESKIILYTTDDGKAQVSLMSRDGRIWLNQKQMAELFAVSKPNISMLISKILAEKELDESVVKYYLTTAADGKKYKVIYYALEMILAVGFRVRGVRGTQFRQWATAHLSEYLVKGFTMDDARLKNPDGRPDYFDELLARIRDIRASEKRFYQKVRDLLALSSDYRGNELRTNQFFAEVQNKLLYAATGHTAAELVVERSDPSKPNMGLMTWKGGIVRKEDVIVAKNYLTADESDTLNRITTIFLEAAELRVKRRMDLTLQFWIEAVDTMLSANLFEVLHGQGLVSHEQAVEISSERYEEFDAVRKKEEARLADEADLDELKRIEDEVKKQQGK